MIRNAILKIINGCSIKDMLKVLIISVIGANLFRLFHLPLPYMLGPIFSLILFQFLYKGSLHWPKGLRNVGLVVVGLAIGQQFNLALFSDLGMLIVYMFILNIGLIIGSIGLAYLLSRWSKLSLKSMILSTIPGGLSQILTFAEEEKDVDLAAVTYFHVTRLILVVVIVPLIVTSHVTPKPESSANVTIGLILLIIISWALALLGKRLSIPVTYFLTPVLITIGLNLGSVPIPAIPSFFMNIALLCIGTHIGLTLKPDMVKLPKRYLISGVLSSFVLLALTYFISSLLSITLDYSFVTSFLSTAPGGLDQMVLLADAIGGDISTVTIFQVFRLLFIFLVVIPALRLIYKWLANRRVVATAEKNRAIH